MKLNPIQAVKILRLAVLAALLMLVSALWGCSDDKPGSSNSSNSNERDVGVCEPGTGKMDDADCNFCKCSDEGQWECTAKACLVDAGDDDDADDDATPRDAGEVCAEGDTKNIDCNGCVCDGVGNWNCTERDCSIYDPCDGLTCGAVCSTCDSAELGCPPVMEYCNADGQCGIVTPECPEDSEECTEGATKKVDCNTCVCDAAGEWGCTKIECHAKAPCEGLACGEACSTCVPTDDGDCTTVMEYCNEAGVCTIETPACGI